jgi:RNA polymerase primary sigma factor
MAEPFEMVFSMTLQETLEGILSHLSEREMKIIQLRFGLAGEGPLTLEETGKLLGITRERVRQIQEKATFKLRNYEELYALRDEP